MLVHWFHQVSLLYEMLSLHHELCHTLLAGYLAEEIKQSNEINLLNEIKSLTETTHGYCTKEELQLRPKLASFTGNSFSIRVKE